MTHGSLGEVTRLTSHDVLTLESRKAEAEAEAVSPSDWQTSLGSAC